MMESDKIIRVILLLDHTGEVDRRLLRGMVRYTKANGRWAFYRIPYGSHMKENSAEFVVRWAKKWKADAIIGRWEDDKYDLFHTLNIPIIFRNNIDGGERYSNIKSDNVEVGRIAARYFKKRLFTNLAFLGISDKSWSEEREKGFIEELGADHYQYFCYKNIRSDRDERSGITQWLKSLPRRTAVFCCEDASALMVTEICQLIGRSVPEDIAVLGVDDDELLCEISDPPISSIQLGVEQGGYEVCRLLHQVVLKNQTGPFNVIIHPMGVHERGSTLVHNIVDDHVLTLLSFIDRNFSSDLKMEDILKQVPLSRRSAEIRFKKAMGITIYRYLLSVRVEHMAYLLCVTDRPLKDIAYEVGFRDLFNVSRTFSKFKGCTPLEFRHRYCVI